MLTRRLHAYVREGADENSWQSRPRHAVLSPTLGRLPPPRETAADLARVMLLLDVSTIARNVGHDLIFATSCCTHSDLGGCADSDADALPARQTTRLCCWHACASVWIATSFRPHPRMHKHDMQMLGGRCSCTRSVRSTQPAAAQHSPRVRQPFDLSTSKCKRDALCNWGALPRPSLREMCGAVHDQTCRSARNRQNNNPRRYRGM